jgi:hypothetical protein
LEINFLPLYICGADKYDRKEINRTKLKIKILLKLKKANNLSFSKRKFNLFKFLFNRLFIKLFNLAKVLIK